MFVCYISFVQTKYIWPVRVVSRKNKKRETILADLHTAGRVHSNAAVMYHAAVSTRMGLSTVEEKTLDLLQRSGDLTAGEITTQTGLAPASVTGLIDRLEAKGFARRVKDPQDGRRVKVQIDPGLESRFAPLFAPFGEKLATLYADYSTEELAVILDFLGRSAKLQLDAARTLSK
ncbi:MAG TPA: MarR family transcriptional regulator [Micromonosporaceae bacterium]|nr:MarR family transcriptional regulator [Micromonosporaceae bacterium]